MKKKFIFFLILIQFCCVRPTEINAESAMIQHSFPSSHNGCLFDFYFGSLVVPETFKVQFSIFTEIISLMILNSGLLKRLIEDAQYERFQPSLSLMNNSLASLNNLLLHPNMLKRFLPRVEDQPDTDSKLLALYRRDTLNPWSMKFLSNQMIDNYKSSSSKTDLYKSLNLYLTQDKPLFIKPLKLLHHKSFSVLRDHFFLAIRKLIHEFIFEMIKQQTGICVPSIHSVSDFCSVEGIEYDFVLVKNGKSIDNLFFNLPSIRFRAK